MPENIENTKPDAAAGKPVPAETGAITPAAGKPVPAGTDAIAPETAEQAAVGVVISVAPSPILWGWFDRSQILNLGLTALTLVVVFVGECRGRREAIERRAADSAAANDRRQTIEAERRTAEAEARQVKVNDSLRTVADEAAATDRRKAAAAAQDNERQRRATVAALDNEVAVRLALLTDSLTAVGIEPTPHRRDDREYDRIARALALFLIPRNRMDQGVRSLTTYDLFANVRSRDRDPSLERAMLYLTGVTSEGDHTSLSSGVGSSHPASEPDTASVLFAEPNSHEFKWRPVFEIVRQFKIERWARRTERVLP